MASEAVTSGALLSDRNCIGCGEQTHAGTIFRTAPEEMKFTCGCVKSGTADTSAARRWDRALRTNRKSGPAGPEALV